MNWEFLKPEFENQPLEIINEYRSYFLVEYQLSLFRAEYLLY